MPSTAAPAPTRDRRRATPTAGGRARAAAARTALAAVVALALTAAAALPAAAEEVLHRLPVDGAVLRAFQAPEGPYGAGHRGVDLDAEPGAPVRASADGVVAFAGSVAGTVWVSIDHADGVRTSYGPMGPVAVAAGQRVARGTVVGTLAAGGHGEGSADRGLHLSARRDGAYLDPMTLPGIRRPRPTLVGAGGWWAFDHAVRPYDAWGGARLGGLLYHGSPDATAPGYAVPPNANHVVVLGGLASSSDHAPLDLAHLGFDARSITHLSYAGRRGTLGDPTDPRRDQLAYGPDATWAGVDAAALILRDQLRAQAAREPGRAVDLVAHSMGGVVLLHYLTHYHDAYDRSLPAIGHIVTIASPLNGSDLAVLAAELGAHPTIGPGVASLRTTLMGTDARLGRLLEGLPLDAPAIGQLATGSDLLAGLDEAWAATLADGTAGALAMGTRVLTIAGGGDRVVGADRASLDPGAGTADLAGGSGDPVLSRSVLPGSHSGVLDTEAVREVTWRFLADQEVVDSPGVLATLLAGGVGATLRLTGGAVAVHGAAEDLLGIGWSGG